MEEPDAPDPVIERFLAEVDRSLLRENLKQIALKRAAGRPKDLEAVAELTALLEERERLKAE